MPDELHIMIRTLETKIAAAERDGQNPVWVTVDVLKIILSVLKAQAAKEK